MDKIQGNRREEPIHSPEMEAPPSHRQQTACPSLEQIEKIFSELGKTAMQIITGPRKKEQLQDAQKFNQQLMAIGAFSEVRADESAESLLGQWLREIFFTESLEKQKQWFKHTAQIIHAAKSLQESGSGIFLKKSKIQQETTASSGDQPDPSKDVSAFEEFFEKISEFSSKEEALKSVNPAVIKMFLADLDEMKYNKASFSQKWNLSFIPALSQLVAQCGERHFLFLAEHSLHNRQNELEKRVAESIGKIHEIDQVQQLIMEEKENLRRELGVVHGAPLGMEFLAGLFIAPMGPITRYIYHQSTKNEIEYSNEHRAVSELIYKEQKKSAPHSTERDFRLLCEILCSIKKDKNNGQVPLTFEISEKIKYLFSTLDHFKEHCMEEIRDKVRFEEKIMSLEKEFSQIDFDTTRTSLSLLVKMKETLKSTETSFPLFKKVSEELEVAVAEWIAEREKTFSHLLANLPNAHDLLEDDEVRDSKIAIFLDQFVLSAQKTEKLLMQVDMGWDMRILLNELTQKLDPEKQYILRSILLGLKEEIDSIDKKMKVDLSSIKRQSLLWADCLPLEKKGSQEYKKAFKKIDKTAHLRQTVGRLLKKNLGLHSVQHEKKEYLYQQNGFVDLPSLQEMEREFLPIAHHDWTHPIDVDGEIFECIAGLEVDIDRMDYHVVGKTITDDGGPSEAEQKQEKIKNLVREVRKIPSSPKAFETVMRICNQGAFATIPKMHKTYFLEGAWPNSQIAESIGNRVILGGNESVRVSFSINPSAVPRGGFCVTCFLEKELIDIMDSLFEGEDKKSVRLVLQATVFQDGTVGTDFFKVDTDTLSEKTIHHVLGQLKKEEPRRRFGLSTKRN